MPALTNAGRNMHREIPRECDHTERSGQKREIGVPHLEFKAGTTLPKIYREIGSNDELHDCSAESRELRCVGRTLRFCRCFMMMTTVVDEGLPVISLPSEARSEIARIFGAIVLP